MDSVSRLPGQGCQHHAGGRCFYEERLNPGYTQGWRCRVLLRWESAFDEFLARAETFGVEQEAVPDLWERQFERMARDVFKCEQYSYCNGSQAPACIHDADGVCKMELPRCEGRCRHYKIEVKQDDIQE